MAQRIGTKCVRAGYRPGNGEPRQIPIYQSTTFRYDSGEALGDLFDLNASGYFYSRLQNPTNDLVASKIVALEGGAAGMLTSSGQAAIFYAILNLATSGDHVVVSSAIYGGAYNLFNTTMRKLGLDFTFVSVDATEEELNAAFKPNTKAVYAETVSNPSTAVLDIELWAKVAHERGVPLVVDNTFPTPINCRPIEWGADIVLHSTSKYMDGHACAVGGAIVDSGKFPWDDHKDKFPGLTTPDESYHGVVYTQKFGQEGAFITKCVVQLMRDLGSIPSPNNSFLLNLGLESLHLRVPRHTENAQKIAEWLEKHPKVAWVDYSGLASSKYNKLHAKYLPNGSCGVASFGLGSRESAQRFLNHLKLISVVTHVSDAQSCALHPASTTHRQLTESELERAGVKQDMIRLSVGIEDVEDLIEDLEQALAAL